MKKKHTKIANYMENIKDKIDNLFNIYSVLFLISPLFVISFILGFYYISSVSIILILFFVISFKKNIVLIAIPFLILCAYYLMIYAMLPITFGGIEVLQNVGFPLFISILVILFLILLFAYIISKIPEIKITKRVSINPLFAIALSLTSLILVFTLLPILNMIFAEDFQSLSDTFSDNVVVDSIGLTLFMAFVATVIGLVVGVPLGYSLARNDFLGKSIIQGIIDLPIVVPHTVAGIALLGVFSATGVIGAPLDEIGVSIAGAWPGIIVAMLFVSTPFIINSAKDAFSSVDPRLENVSRNLGASRLKTFSLISFPLASRGIFTGAVMSWARSVSEFGAIIILVYYPRIAPILIYDRFTSFGLSYSRPIAVLLILVCLVIFISLRMFTSIEKRRV